LTIRDQPIQEDEGEAKQAMDDMAKATQEQSAISPGSDVSAHATDIERIYVKSLALCREEWPQSIDRDGGFYSEIYWKVLGTVYRNPVV
jgi:hypothetical protein